jgi:anti-anti-sigma factor
MTIDRIGEAIVARMGPRYDAFHEADSARFEEELLRAVATTQTPRVVLDMSKTDYFSSAMIETLFRVWKKISANGDGRMVLAGASPFCREIIATARLEQLWPLFPDVESAVAGIRICSDK